MARPIRIEYEGAVYHVTLRGNERKPIFKTDADRERFIRTLSDSVDRFDIRLYLYCLMHNHVHLVLETPRANLSRFMHRLQTAYTVYFNRRHRRCGHLMQGRLAAKFLTEYGGLSQRDVGLLLKIRNGASVSKQIKKISHILASNQEVQETHKDIRKLLKLKERTDP